MLSPDSVRRVMWTPPAADAAAVAAQLTSYGARAWQVDLVTPLLVDAIASAETETEIEAEAEPQPED